MDKKYIDKFIDTTFFDFPKGKLKSAYYGFRLHNLKSAVEILSPCLLVCNKACGFEEYLIRQNITTDFVTLKPWVVDAVYNETLSSDDKKRLFANIKMLKNAMISIVVFPERQISVFGKSQHLPEKITEFLFETGLNLKFISFENAYFARPIWSKSFRNVQTAYSSKFNLSSSLLASMTPDERNSKINKSMPSSAAIYGHKNRLVIASNRLAEGLERVVYACPNCHEFFGLRAEFSHLKCQNCLVPFECTPGGEIYTNGKTITFDQLEDFLLEILKNKDFKKNHVASFDGIVMNVFVKGVVIHEIQNLKLDIFVNKLKIAGIGFEKEISLKDVTGFEYLPENAVKLTLKSNEVISLVPSGNENMFVIYNLIKNKKS